MEIKDLKSYLFMWKNDGKLPEDPEVSLTVKDAIATPNASVWMPKVIQNIVKEAQEPLLVGTSLLRRIPYHAGVYITFPAVGALVAADIAEGMAYPEQQLSLGGATAIASVGKSGLAFKITEEMIRYSQFPIIRMHMEAAGKALARHKEQKIFNHILGMGVVTHDNAAPTQSIYGVTSGRAANGAGNGSVTMDDLFDMYAQVMYQGYIPNTLLMHPLTWNMFVKDPIMRHLMMHGANGGGVMFASYTGTPAARAPWDTQGGMGMASGQNIVPGGNAAGAAASSLEEYPQTISSAPIIPSYFPFPFRVIVSPFMPYDPVTKLTDIVMFDSNSLGALLVDEEVTVDQWNDQSVDIQKIKLRERYGIAILDEGQAIAVAKNVKCVPNVWHDSQITASIDASGWSFPLPPTTPVV